MSVDLRPYQDEIVAEFERHVERSDRSILLVAPTGSGKTVIASAIVAGTPRRVLVVSHRRWDCIAKWSAAACARLPARPTSSFSTTVAPCSSMAYPKTACSDRSIPTGEPYRLSIKSGRAAATASS